MKPSSTLSTEFASKLVQIESARARLEDLKSQDLISERTILQLYEGLFLKSYVAFEAFIEDLFVGLVLTNKGVSSQRRDIVPRAEIKSHAVLWGLLLGQKSKYVDWLPYGRTIELAEKFLRSGRPFSELTNAEKDLITRTYKIRNAIAHGSKYSLKKFQDGVLPATLLPRNERTPAGFLRGIFRVNPAQTRFEVYTSELLRISRKLSA